MATDGIKTVNATVDTTSSDYDESIAYWRMCRDMFKGAKAMRANAAVYLPKFESEDDTQFKLRAKNARYTNIFGDIVRNLADRPFVKELTIKAHPRLEPMFENIDGQNNHISVFAHAYFREAITTGIQFAFVDYANINPYVVDASGRARRRSVAEERAMGARPYVVTIRPEDVIAIYSGMAAGKEYITHVRIREKFKMRDGWNEVCIETIRVLNREPLLDADGNIVDYAPATYELYERKDGKEWGVVAEGTISIGDIALEPLVLGTRYNGWLVEADMEDCVYLQLEYFEQENGLKNIKTLTAYPMLSASGVNPEMDPKTKTVKKAPVGPRAVLYGTTSQSGTAGKWEWIEPAGTSLSFLRDDLKELAKELRELGRQPLTASSSNITKETAMFAAFKGKAAMKRWTGSLKDALENILMYMARWEGIDDEPEVTLNMDDTDELSGDDGFDNVLSMYDKGMISISTVRIEALRRGILNDNFDANAEDEQILNEMPDEPTVQDNLNALPDNGIVSPPEDDPNFGQLPAENPSPQ